MMRDETTDTRYRPLLTNAGMSAAYPAAAVDEQGQRRDGHIAGERPLTLYLDKHEVVTLMTLGTNPELLTLGYVMNQGLVPSLESIESIQVDWEAEAVAVTTFAGVNGLDRKLAHRTVTTGCGQGTVFGRITDELDELRLVPRRLRQSELYRLLDHLKQHNEVYRQAGAVHGCALCRFDRHRPAVEIFVEDVGRHNAADAIAGHLWLNALSGQDKILYTTGRLTSEMVVKVAQMGVPILLSRSGVTQKGLEFARRVGVMMIARAKGQHFLIFHGAERFVFDAKPTPLTASRKLRRVSIAH